MFVRSFSSISNKIISLKKIISPQPVGAPQKEKKPRVLGTCPVCPLVKAVLRQSAPCLIKMLPSRETEISRLGVDWTGAGNVYSNGFARLKPIENRGFSSKTDRVGENFGTGATLVLTVICCTDDELEPSGVEPEPK